MLFTKSRPQPSKKCVKEIVADANLINNNQHFGKLWSAYGHQYLMNDVCISLILEYNFATNFYTQQLLIRLYTYAKPVEIKLDKKHIYFFSTLCALLLF